MHLKKRLPRVIVLIPLVFAFSSLVYGHGDEVQAVSLIDPLLLVYASIAILFAVMFFVFIHQGQFDDSSKKILFGLIAIPVLIATLYLGGHTIYENTLSETGGPVHWHADYQVWMCGERLDLVNPEFPSNKIGNPFFHEHNDNRIHIEGAVRDIPDVNLGNFFSVVGGVLKQDYFFFPSSKGDYEVRTGESCGDVESSLAVYVNGKIIEEYTQYLIYPDPAAPPGDCIIVSFASNNEDTTSQICESWQAKGWEYDSFTRRPKAIGDHVWQ
ncbi:MAG: hypothetical protein O2779_01930 [Nanoarchaeota archaeon]|nr:hypothetical protein [Nanoarchaeota archaeon]